MPSRARKFVPTRSAGVAGNILWSGASRGLQAVTGFVATVAVARHLPLAGLGEYLSALAVAGAVLSVSYCGIQQYLVRELGRGADDPGALVGAGVLIRLAIIGLAGLGLAGWAGFAPAGSRADLAALVLVAFGCEACRSMGQLAGAVFQGQERMRPECLLALLHSLLWGVLLTMAIRLGSGPFGLLVASGLALAGHCLASWIVVARGAVRPRFGAGCKRVARMLRASLVIGLSVILLQNLFRVNVLLLQWLGTSEEVAFFQTPHDLVLRLQILFQAVMLAAFPALSRLFAVGPVRGAELTLALGRLVAASAGGLASTLYLFADPLLVMVYGGKMVPAVSCLRVLALGTVPLALGLVWSQVLIATGGQRRVLWVNAAALAFNGLLGVVLTPRYGVFGASVAALAAYATSALGALWAARGLFRGRIAALANLQALAALGGGLLVSAVLPGRSGGPAGLAAYAALLLVLRGVGLSDIRVLTRCVRPVGPAVRQENVTSVEKGC